MKNVIIIKKENKDTICDIIQGEKISILYHDDHDEQLSFKIRKLDEINISKEMDFDSFKSWLGTNQISISPDADTKLRTNPHLLQTTVHIIIKIFNIKNIDFTIHSIDIDDDPENPSYKPLLICIEINSDDFNEIIEIENIVYNDAIIDIPEKELSEIYIVTIAP